MSRLATWRYVVPSLLTCTSITVGFAGIAEAINGRFESAAWLILLCVLLDKTDGAAARMLHSSTRFGMELDSLSDLITFGVAPAVLTLSLLARPEPGGLAQVIPLYGLLVYICAGLYVVAAALRLAKFNVVCEAYGKRHFFGFPTTIVGALICCYILTVRKYALSPVYLQALPLILVVFALLMVSRVPVRKPGLRKSRAFNVFAVTQGIAIYLFGILRLFPEYLMALGVAYLLLTSIWSTMAGVKPPRLQPALAATTATDLDESGAPDLATSPPSRS